MRADGLLKIALMGGMLLGCSFGSQSPDLDFRFPNETPRFAVGEGPRVGIDAGHGNFHTVDGRFGPFARLLRDDGYVVEGFAEPFSAEALSSVDVLVIANSLAEENVKRWRLPNPSAFDDGEIQALVQWVEAGGSLMLIADHMPFPGAAEELAEAFGVFFLNGYAQDAIGSGHIIYWRDEGHLRPHEVTDGTNPEERIEKIKVFTGQAFRALPETDAEPLMVMPAGSRVLLPSKPRDFSERTPYALAEGLWQGATLRRGKGRVAVFGEAAMFTAQVAVSRNRRLSFGMSDPEADQNPRFALNVLRWLTPEAEGEARP